MAWHTRINRNFFACGEGPFGRRPHYPDDPVDPVQLNFKIRIYSAFSFKFYSCLSALTWIKGPVFVRQNKLTPCPSSPNCVSSLSKDRVHFIEPLQYEGSRKAARQRLIKILNKLTGARVTLTEPDYIRAEFRSRIFQFVDDVEFLFENQRNIIHVKSASRIGYSDFGVNRKRVEKIRAAFESPRS